MYLWVSWVTPSQLSYQVLNFFPSQAADDTNDDRFEVPYDEAASRLQGSFFSSIIRGDTYINRKNI